MSSDSGITPMKAKQILSHANAPDCLAIKCKGFLQGVAYQEEKAKGLVEALEYIADQITPPNLDRASDKAKQALAHYRQGQLNEK